MYAARSSPLKAQPIYVETWANPLPKKVLALIHSKTALATSTARPAAVPTTAPAPLSSDVAVAQHAGVALTNGHAAVSDGGV